MFSAKQKHQIKILEQLLDERTDLSTLQKLREADDFRERILLRVQKPETEFVFLSPRNT